MKHLVKSFQEHLGTRGCHFYDEEKSVFLPWMQVLHLIDSLPDSQREESFSEKLALSLSNYNPDNEFLAVRQSNTSLSVELYSHMLTIPQPG